MLEIKKICPSTNLTNLNFGHTVLLRKRETKKERHEEKERQGRLNECSKKNQSLNYPHKYPYIDNVCINFPFNFGHTVLLREAKRERYEESENVEEINACI